MFLGFERSQRVALEALHEIPNEEHHHGKEYQADSKLKECALLSALDGDDNGRTAFWTSPRTVADRFAAFVAFDKGPVEVNMLRCVILQGICLDAGSGD